MQIERLQTLEPRATAPCAAAIGNFDGVHRGHARLVAETVASARALGGRAVVLTFDPHPARVLAPGSAPCSLLTLEQKAEILGTLGVDTLAVLPFTPAVALLEAEEFARDVLASCLGAAAVVVGDDFRFGRGRAGDGALLAELGERLGFTVTRVEPVTHLDEPISSTRVRRALAAGDVATAADLLGRRFFVDGVVEAGDGRGRGLGFPTANVATSNETLPANGVYACLFAVGGEPPREAVANLGTRPTFEGGAAPRLEVHALDTDRDLYGRSVRTAFVERLRGEQRFPDAEALSLQIAEDVARAREVLADAI
ncbi:MAG: bifunctional riboflavin kinase/FAD synthetase [Vicinamibacteria bacterium]